MTAPRSETTTSGLAPAPRHVPRSLRVRLLFGGFGVLAWIWFGFVCSMATAGLREGMRGGVVGPEFAVPAILLPVVGLVAVIGAWHSGRRKLHMLEHGRLTLGTLVGKRATYISINKRRVMELRFEIQDEYGARRELTVRTHMPEAATDEPRERLLYDPAFPERAIAWDLFPGSIRIGSDGALMPAGLVGTVAVLIPPAMAVLGPALALLVGLP